MSGLPEKKPLPRVRKISAELEPALYLRLEIEAFQRNISPYKLASLVLVLYLAGKLKESSESPAPEPDPERIGFELQAERAAKRRR